MNKFRNRGVEKVNACLAFISLAQVANDQCSAFCYFVQSRSPSFSAREKEKTLGIMMNFAEPFEFNAHPESLFK